jgi:hypothetical protein
MDASTKTKKTRYAVSNLNALEVKPTAPQRLQTRSGSAKLEVLEVRQRVGKLKKSKKADVAVPKPLNTPSLSHEHNGQDPTIDIIATAGGTGWGQGVEAANNSAAPEKQQRGLKAAAEAPTAQTHQTTGPWAAPGTTTGGAPAAAAAPPKRRGLSDFNPFERITGRNTIGVVVRRCCCCQHGESVACACL